MSKASTQERNLGAARRGLIVQRVLVDGSSPAAAGAPFGVGEKQVADWVAAYRLHGMASLRGEAAADLAPHRSVARWVASFSLWLRGRAGPAGRRFALRRETAGGPHDPTRRSRWN